jgi:arylsulfatase A-like enzyme
MTIPLQEKKGTGKMGTVKHSRRDFLKVMGLGAASLPDNGTASEKAAGRDRPPNIIFTLADDLGYGDLGCYGQKTIRTPNLDRMAAEGIRFTQHYAGSTVCAPSRCVLMTGLHTGHCYVRGNRAVRPMGQVPLPSETITVAELLKKAGYATALIGKWGLGGPDSSGIPNRQGFDYFFGYLCQRHAHNYYPEFLFRNEDKVPLTGNKVDNPRSDGAGRAIERAQYSHDLLAREALAYVERNRDRPFFLYLALTIPHANNEAGDKGMEVPAFESYADMDWPEPQKGHAAMITRMDRDIGTLLGKLQKLGLDRDTLVMFSSDNGPHREGGADPRFFTSAGPLRGIKRDLYEGGIRVPLIARWPGRIRPGSVSEHVSAFWDFLPTCAELAGVVSPAVTDGISLVPVLTGEPKRQNQHEFLYWEFHERGFNQAVRMGDWKAVRFQRGNKLELYDLKTDPGEKHDVAAERPEIVERIEVYRKGARSPSKLWPGV